MKKAFNYIGVISIIALLASCVPQRKLEEEQTKRSNCEKELADLKTANQNCESKLDEATKSLADNNRRIQQLLKDTAYLGDNYRTFSSKYQNLLVLLNFF